ncbi:MAG: phosphatidate cytidylyltransferase [Dysgonamonadaceae bacterium]|jgi:phosphatidate cytidylyltransferase|nr:phosphatidate cytidylyltransferase [Dysgonamonadaceae bacterium]MDD3356323.1 phosphatidate cytidylyltransferase [Dysgonamonadaceae bacterium]MDD3727030.1 phosphatidate cytidylyltransferase [Dysgonamonadaceae bacterium]MDD4245636.1 phosphatidate cytidylyltransferase [Dysgonamonadaceae bacterium]MDD4604767.1 phosphatidate cytidylyltransferase [Dysgonamonadaceae bacterium]
MFNRRNLITRAITGAVYIFILLFGILYNKYSFIVVFGIILVVALDEFYRLIEQKTPHLISKLFNILFGVVIFLSAYLFLEGKSILAFPISSITYLLFLYASTIVIKRPDIFNTIIYSVFGQLYITLPFCLLLLISYEYKLANPIYYYALVLAIFVFIWVNDTFAFLIGITIGKHKLLRRISPKKTIEGFIGGIFFTVLSGIGFSFLYTEYTIYFWIGFALIVSLFATLGDLFESLIKRTYKVKDSGNLIPGHGGILDRIDSLLIVVPPIYVYILITNSFI